MPTRRNFLKTAGIIGAGLMMANFAERSACAFNQSSGLGPTLFSQSLRGIDTIPAADVDPFVAPITGVAHYTINVNEFTDTLHPNLGLTKL